MFLESKHQFIKLSFRYTMVLVNFCGARSLVGQGVLPYLGHHRLKERVVAIIR